LAPSTPDHARDNGIPNARHPRPDQTAHRLHLHRLRHSAATHLEAGADATVIMAKTHRSLPSVVRYTRPGLAAVTAATELAHRPIPVDRTPVGNCCAVPDRCSPAVAHQRQGPASSGSWLGSSPVATASPGR
jgi:hypothetical protein